MSIRTHFHLKFEIHLGWRRTQSGCFLWQPRPAVSKPGPSVSHALLPLLFYSLAHNLPPPLLSSSCQRADAGQGSDDSCKTPLSRHRAPASDGSGKTPLAACPRCTTTTSSSWRPRPPRTRRSRDGLRHSQDGDASAGAQRAEARCAARSSTLWAARSPMATSCSSSSSPRSPPTHCHDQEVRRRKHGAAARA